ncbi:MAG: protoporphyrinogen/coproporphyrinogen oxidase [Gemmatimonadota bacterium]
MAVVGAGISGLALGLELRNRGAEFDIFEAAAAPGGVVRSSRTGAGLLEWGPQRLRLVPPVRKIVEDVGLADRLVFADPTAPLFVVRGGRMHRVPRSIRDLLTGSLLSPASRLRVLAEPATAAVRSTETVAEALTRKFGREAYAALLGPLFGGLYASDPADMRAADSLLGLLDRAGRPRSLLLRALRLENGSPPACSFRDGLGELPAALARVLAGELNLRHPVETMTRAADGWTLRVGGAVRGPYRSVILSVPAHEAARILMAPARPAAERLGRLRYNRLAMVHLQASGESIAGFGYQVAFGEGLETRGVTFNDALLGRGRIVTAFLGGASSPRVPDWADERIAAVAEREFRQVTGRGAETLEVSRPRVPSYDSSWEALDGLPLPEGVHLCANYIERPGIGGRFAQAKRMAEELG